MKIEMVAVSVKRRGYRKVSRWRGKKFVFRKEVDLSKWKLMPVEDIGCYHSVDLIDKLMKLRIEPDPSFVPPTCDYCGGSGVDPNPEEFGVPYMGMDGMNCRYCLGNGVLLPEAEYSERNGQLIGYNYPVQFNV